jgi:hypothetical protein
VTASIAVITPSSAPASDHPQNDHFCCSKIDEEKPKGNMHTMPLHDTEEFYHDLRGRAYENLALSTALSVDNVFLQRFTFR